MKETILHLKDIETGEEWVFIKTHKLYHGSSMIGEIKLKKEYNPSVDNVYPVDYNDVSE